MFKKKILVIDDSELIARLISDILKAANYDVVIASNGEIGIVKVREEKPDLVILDGIMPGMSGFEVCKILRDDVSNNLMPIIMLTGQEREDDKLIGLEIGADDYITKPFNHRELVSRVNNTLRRIDRNRWANPLTGLHGNIEITSEINHRIAIKRRIAVIYADLDNFKAYNDVYGFSSGDTAIKLTTDIIKDNVNMCGNKSDFIGHVGGDDFVVITTPDKVEEISKGIISDFDEKIINLYTIEDRRRGFIVTKNRQEEIMKYPIMSISLAIVTNDNIELIGHLQVAEISASIKKKAKGLKGSNFIKG